ncbi:hypothetical protein [Actinacidiphila acididurans]|uniref:Lipoprotein n=1 Tax=Actinacidiphila acididurans TaxID=2784346 RepID=A0ABS2TQQ9_9ACTN|nr:hypothetical protein [Actinacidiphila acididurans]MBM9504605.1 hypothetical protein [Actinacidiphila acididurans]
MSFPEPAAEPAASGPGRTPSTAAKRRRRAARVRAAVPVLLAAAAALTACAHPAPTRTESAAAPRPTASSPSASPSATSSTTRPLPAPAPLSPARAGKAPAAPARTAHTLAAARTQAPPAPPRPTAARPVRAPAPRTIAPVTPSATPPAAPRPLARTGAVPDSPGGMTLRIGDWSRPVVRGGQDAIDRCAAAVLFTGPDPRQADGYKMQTSVIVGHDFCGFAELAPLPPGTHVTLEAAGLTYSYHVYASYIGPGQGGPDNGLYWGDLTLQTCVGQDTAFSYLTRDRG